MKRSSAANGFVRFTAVTVFSVCLAVIAAPATGPLKVHPDNPRYFTDGAKSPDGRLKAVYLAGSHTWPNLMDRGPKDPPPVFDFDQYLKLLEAHNHNFIRLWRH